MSTNISIGIEPPFCPACGGTMVLRDMTEMGEAEPSVPASYRLVFECTVDRDRRLRAERGKRRAAK